MGNQMNQDSDYSENQEHTSFYDQADDTFNKKISDKEIKLSRGVKSDEEETDETDEDISSFHSPEEQVRETEDASLQDHSYSFDEDNTENEEYHDASDAEEYDPDGDGELLH